MPCLDKAMDQVPDQAPVLALNGSRDVQVPPKQNLPAIASALTQGGNTDFTE